MQLMFCGAARSVTGSCFYVKSEKVSFLVDCGMIQGGREEREKNRRDFPFNPGELDYVLLTHAHIDHSGLIPRLVMNGFKGTIISTRATAELCGIMLPDSGHIQEMEAEWRNRKRARLGESPEEPLYTAADAMASLGFFRPVGYGEEVELQPGLRVRFVDAGHILGSASIEVWIEENGIEKKLVFSGDLGQTDQPIIRDPVLIEEADLVLVESTYGARLHENRDERLKILAEIINESVRTGGNLVIPSFAVGRTQDLLYHINRLQQKGDIPVLPVYIDSPMAVSATEIFRRHEDCFDRETLKLLQDGESPFELPNLRLVRTTEESRALNEHARGSIIISASGMCEAGRILHHLKHNLWRPEAHIVFVGFQAQGTLGRRLLDGATAVKLFGEEVAVRAKIHGIEGFSAHADQKGLLRWLKGFEVPPQQIFLVHGEESTMETWAPLVRQEIGIEPVVPSWGESFAILGTQLIKQAPPEKVDQKWSILRALKSTELDLGDLRRRLQQRMESMDPRSLESLTDLLKEIQSRIRRVE